MALNGSNNIYTVWILRKLSRYSIDIAIFFPWFFRFLCRESDRFRYGRDGCDLMVAQVAQTADTDRRHVACSTGDRIGRPYKVQVGEWAGDRSADADRRDSTVLWPFCDRSRTFFGHRACFGHKIERDWCVGIVDHTLSVVGLGVGVETKWSRECPQLKPLTPNPSPTRGEGLRRIGCVGRVDTDRRH